MPIVQGNILLAQATSAQIETSARPNMFVHNTTDKSMVYSPDGIAKYRYDDRGYIEDVLDARFTNIDASNIANGTISNAEFQALNNISSNIQLQLDSKQNRVPYIITNLDANSYNDNGIFAGYDVAHAPNALWGILRVWNASTDAGDQVWQEWRTASYGDQTVWKRGSYDYGATWSDWYKNWDSANFNPANKSDVGHIHDDRYYTETETNSLLSNKSDVSHTHTSILVNGSAPASSATPSSWLPSGLYLNTVYNQDFPSGYGNVLSMDATGSTQIYQGWSGVNAGSERMWFRNKRDSFDGWSPWQRVIDTVSDATSISNWNTAYTSAHFHNNRSNLDSINQNLSTTSQALFSDVTTTAATYSRYGYFGNHTGWVDSAYALRVYGDSLFGNANISTGKQLFTTKDITPTTASNTNYSSAPIVINRSSDSGTSNVAGIGFHNIGVNASTLYYDPATSVFKYNRDVAGPLVTIWDDSNFTPSSKSDVGHIHDDRYYTESETNSLLSGKLERVPTIITNNNANSYNDNGIFAGYNVVNAPNTLWGILRVWNAATDSGDQVWQEWRNAAYGDQSVWKRGSADFGANWTDWIRNLDSANDSSLLANSHTHTNRANLDVIDQSLALSASPSFVGLSVGNVSPIEFSYLDGVTSNIQNQINNVLSITTTNIVSVASNTYLTSNGRHTSATIPSNTFTTTVPVQFKLVGNISVQYTGGTANIEIKLNGNSLFVHDLTATGATESDVFEIDFSARHAGSNIIELYGLCKICNINGATQSPKMRVVSNTFTMNPSSSCVFDVVSSFSGTASSAVTLVKVTKG
jgi:hypothetical protein